MTEKTLVRIGDDCTLNAGAILQCHSHGGRRLQVRPHRGRLRRARSASAPFVHYGVTIGDGAVLAPDSFLMKGTEVPTRARWQGNPAREVAVADAPGCACGSDRGRLPRRGT